VDEIQTSDTGPASRTKHAPAGVLRAAGRLVAMQAEKTKLLQITVPRLYAALGKSICGNPTLQQDFAQQIKAMERLRDERRGLEAIAKQRPSGASLVDKAKKVALEATDLAQTKAVDMRIFQALVDLGTKAYASHGEKSGTTEEIAPLAAALSRTAELQRDLADLDKRSKGQVLSPKLLVCAALGLGFLALCGVAINRRGGPSDSQSAQSDPNDDSSRRDTSGDGSDAHGVSQDYLDAYKKGEAAARHWVTQIERARDRGLPPQAIAQYVKSLNMIVEHHERTFNAVLGARNQGGRMTPAIERCRGLYEGAKDTAGKYAQ